TQLRDPSQARTPNTVIITSAGVNPQDAHLDAPVTVTFMNKDTVPHTPEAAPELGNGDCPEMAEVGTIAPEQSGKVTITKTEYICSYHDKAQPSNVKFKGVIVVH